MSKPLPTLGIELRFLPNDQTPDWKATFDALWSWDPDLRPQAFQVASGEGWDIDGDRPWNDARSAELARLCAGRAEFSWFMGNDSGHYLQCRGRDGRVSPAIQIPVPNTSIALRYLDLIARLPASNRPELGLVFNHGDGDATFDEEGLWRLRFIPPVLHLGPRAVEKLGGASHLRQAPCEVRDAPGSGLVFVVRPYPFNKATTDEVARTAAVASLLGIEEDTPLVLIPRPGSVP